MKKILWLRLAKLPSVLCVRTTLKTVSDVTMMKQMVNWLCSNEYVFSRTPFLMKAGESLYRSLLAESDFLLKRFGHENIFLRLGTAV